MEYPIIDGHCDTVRLFDTDNYDFSKRNGEGHLDLPRLKEGNVKLQFFALYIEEEYKPVGSLKRCLTLLERYFETMESCPDDFITIYSAADLKNLFNSDKIGALLCIEGGEALEGEIAVLQSLFRLGIRAIGLTWNQQNQLATGVGSGIRGEGLTSFGKNVIVEMNRMGMLVDLAHINEDGFFEAVETSSKPVVVSHANARSLCNHPRNLSDEELKKLSENDGVIGVSFYPDFIDPKNPTFDRLLDHFVYIADIIGTEHLGIGSDFDGIDKVLHGLEDVTGLSGLITGLKRRGFTSEDIARITSKNFYRILSDVLP
ncbi:MAG: dipeptidase [Bacillota bacterium]|nr:dipeptidase [Bacillota bacterium]